MLSVESLPVAEEEVVESSSNKLGDIYTFVAKGSFPQTMNPIRKKNLKRYAQKFIIDGRASFSHSVQQRCVLLLFISSSQFNSWLLPPLI